MIFNNSKKLHRLINCWGTGVGSSPGLGGPGIGDGDGGPAPGSGPGQSGSVVGGGTFGGLSGFGGDTGEVGNFGLDPTTSSKSFLKSKTLVEYLGEDHLFSKALDKVTPEMVLQGLLPGGIFGLGKAGQIVGDFVAGLIGGEPDLTGGIVGDQEGGPDISQEQYDQLMNSFGMSKDEVDQISDFMSSTPQTYNEVIEKSLQDIRDIDTDIKYNKTLADLSGIQMDETEKALLDSQKNIAIDRALSTIEDTFSQEGESMVAQQIQNLGTNALGGTIGQGFVKRWQEREASAKTGALQDIESTYLAAERQAIDTQKQRQIDMWGKQYDADISSAELSLDKAKSAGALNLDWAKTQFSGDQAALDRALQERMGNREYGAWDDANKWGAIGGLAGSVFGSDWFGDWLTG